MSVFPNVPRGRAFLGWPPVTLILAAIAIALAVSAGRVVLRARAIAEERASLEVRAYELEAERIRLERASDALASPEAVERLAKERLNLKNPGEEVVVVLPARPSPAEAAGGGFAGFLSGWLANFAAFFGR